MTMLSQPNGPDHPQNRNNAKTIALCVIAAILTVGFLGHRVLENGGCLRVRGQRNAEEFVDVEVFSPQGSDRLPAQSCQ